MIPVALAAGFLRKHWHELAIALAFAIVLAAAFGLRAQAKHYRTQRDEARAALAVAEAIGQQQAERTARAEKAAHDALERARQAEARMNAEADDWQRMAAARDRDLRLCRAAPRTGAVPGPGHDSPGGASADGGTVSRPVGEDLAGLVRRADRFRDGLARCYAAIDASR